MLCGSVDLPVIHCQQTDTTAVSDDIANDQGGRKPRTFAGTYCLHQGCRLALCNLSSVCLRQAVLGLPAHVQVLLAAYLVDATSMVWVSKGSD